MASRATITALIILLVTLGTVFVAVGNADLSTSVFVADQPTPTPAPTIGPSPTALPDPAAENWQESAPGQLTYLPQPESGAQIYYDVTTLEGFAQSLGMAALPAEAAYPMLAALETMREGFEAEIAELGLSAGPGALDGPVIELINGVPMSRLRVRLDAQEFSSGGAFPGLDLLIGLIERPEGEIQVVQYRLQNGPDPVIYQDFRAWLESKAVEFSGAMSDAPADDPAGVEATEDPGDATAAPADDPATATDEPAEAGAMSADGPWNELAEGILIYSADPMITAQITYRSMTIEAFVAGSSFEAPDADAEAPMFDLLAQLRETLAGQLAGQGVALTEDAFTGPEAIEIAGKPAARLRLTALAEALPNEQPSPGLEMEVILVELPDQQLTAIQYVYQGDPEASVYSEFVTWLDENAARVTVPAAPAAEPAVEPDAAGTPEATEESASD